MPPSFTTTLEQACQELFVNGKLEAIDRFFAPDYLVHFEPKGTARGHAVIEQSLRGLRRAFPALQVAVEILVVGDRRIAWQRTFAGVQAGAYKSFPASQRELVWRDMVTTEFRDGLIAKEWLVSDLAERLLLARKR